MLSTTILSAGSQSTLSISLRDKHRAASCFFSVRLPLSIWHQKQCILRKKNRILILHRLYQSFYHDFGFKLLPYLTL